MAEQFKDDWPSKRRPKSKLGRIPYNYMVNPEDEYELIPDPVITKHLEAALDRLDQDESLRATADWLFITAEKELSHMGLDKIWKEKRAHLDTPRAKRLKERKFGVAKAREIQKNRRKGAKIGAIKRKITAQEKKLEAEMLKQRREKEHIGRDLAQIKYDFEEIPEEREIIFKPNEGPQTDFLAASEQEVLYGGAAGGGKSYGMLADPLRYFGNKNFVGLLLRRTNDELKELKRVSQQLYPKAVPGAKWKEKDSMWVFPSGAQFWMTYLDRDEDVLRYQGQAFTWIGVDELTQYPTPYAWDYLRSRLRTTDPELRPHLSMRGTTNPGGPGHHWVKRMFIDPAPPNQTFDALSLETGEVLRHGKVYPRGHPNEGEPNPKAGQPLFQRRFIPASLYDNPYLAEDGAYEASLLSLPENERRKLLEGDWSVMEGAAFPEFRPNIHVCEPFPIPREWRRFRSCDYGYSSASAVHWYAVDPSYDTLYVYRELYTSHKTGKALAQMVMELEKDERIDYGVLDSSVWHQRGGEGPSIAEEMIAAGCRWRPSDRSKGSRTNGKNRLHELLKVEDYGGVFESPGIVFFDTCRQIIADLPMLPTHPDGEDDIDRKYPMDHAYDSIRYGISSRPSAKSSFEDWLNKENSGRFRPADPVFGY